MFTSCFLFLLPHLSNWGGRLPPPLLRRKTGEVAVLRWKRKPVKTGIFKPPFRQISEAGRRQISEAALRIEGGSPSEEKKTSFRRRKGVFKKQPSLLPNNRLFYLDWSPPKAVHRRSRSEEKKTCTECRLRLPSGVFKKQEGGSEAERKPPSEGKENLLRRAASLPPNNRLLKPCTECRLRSLFKEGGVFKKQPSTDY